MKSPQREPVGGIRNRTLFFLTFFGAVVFLGGGGIFYFVDTGRSVGVNDQATVSGQSVIAESSSSPQFPIGVNPQRKEIVENPVVDTYFEKQLFMHPDPTSRHVSWLGRTLGKLAQFGWFQNLASVSSRILVIESGERKEEVANHFTKIMGWTGDQKKEFLKIIESSAPLLADGKFYPGTYTVTRGATPNDVATLIVSRFNSEVLTRYGADIEVVVPLKQSLTIASILEREAYDFNDMRDISGVIWNRLFADMNLQIDATLQYAKGSKPNETWWPKVIPADKYIASVYNTYKNPGLPPAPIANPSVEAIVAALNPTKTDCMFYFHDAHANFHCSKTYQEHVALLKQYYGRGK